MDTFIHRGRSITPLSTLQSNLLIYSLKIDPLAGEWRALGVGLDDDARKWVFKVNPTALVAVEKVVELPNNSLGYSDVERVGESYFAVDQDNGKVLVYRNGQLCVGNSPLCSVVGLHNFSKVLSKYEDCLYYISKRRRSNICKVAVYQDGRYNMSRHCFEGFTFSHIKVHNNYLYCGCTAGQNSYIAMIKPKTMKLMKVATLANVSRIAAVNPGNGITVVVDSQVII